MTTPGTFDPIAQGAYNPAGTDPKGQTLHGDHAYVFYQSSSTTATTFRTNPARIPGRNRWIESVLTQLER